MSSHILPTGVLQFYTLNLLSNECPKMKECELLLFTALSAVIVVTHVLQLPLFSTSDYVRRCGHVSPVLYMLSDRQSINYQLTRGAAVAAPVHSETVRRVAGTSFASVSVVNTALVSLSLSLLSSGQ